MTRSVRIALDVMGGDHAPASVLDGALIAADANPDVTLLLVGPADLTQAMLAERGCAGRFEVVDATEVVEMDEDPARATRSKRDATVRVCARLVRDGGATGGADAMVSVGATGAALSAAMFTLGRLPGIGRPPLAAVVPAKTGPLVFLDVGANPESSVELLAQYAVVGTAFATLRLGIGEPRVGLLTIGAEAGKGDVVRKEAYDLLGRLPIRFVGNVEGRDIPMGGAADVVVTDGFTGNVLLKGLEGAAAMFTGLLREAMTSTPERSAAAKELLPAFEEATAHMHPDVLGGAVLLGVDGVVVVGHGGASPRAVASCVDVALQAVREGLVRKIAAALDQLQPEAVARVAP